MPDTPKQITLTIDGKAVTVPDGATVLQACSPRPCPDHWRGKKANLPAASY